MTTPDPQKREHLKIASRIAKKLLTNGIGVHVNRLALTNDDGKNHGGWCELAVRDVVADELDRTAARKRRQKKMTTPEQIEAQASADHERKIEEAEWVVIDAAKEVSAIDKNKANGSLELLLSVHRPIIAVDALNALTTSVESLPEKVDEWDGFRVFKTQSRRWVWTGKELWVSFNKVRPVLWTKSNEYPSLEMFFMQWAPDELRGIFRLDDLLTLPDDLVKAAKGVGNAK